MPFFPSTNVLFLHVPKTGGTSIENYFSKKWNTPLNIHSLYYRCTSNIQNEIDVLRKIWRHKVNVLFDAEIKNIYKKYKHKEQKTRISQIKSNIKEYMNGLKYSIPEFQQFKKLRIIRDKRHSLHHFTALELDTYKNVFLYNKSLLDSAKIYVSVRNPYERIISELFFIRVIHAKSTKKDVYEKIKNYLESKSDFDNHKIPQYKYIVNENEELYPNIFIIKTEQLEQDMKKYGFDDFLSSYKHLHNKKYNNKKYYDLLNEDSIALINDYYKKDFEIFNYKMLQETNNDNTEELKDDLTK
jgi:hypothetical protein